MKQKKPLYSLSSSSQAMHMTKQSKTKRDAPLLQVDNLAVRFHQYGRGFKQRELHVIRNLSLQVEAGQMVAVVGASGSGKSLLAEAILGVLPSNAEVEGIIRYKGCVLTSSLQKKLRGTSLAYIPQSIECLDPLMRVGKQVQGVRGLRARQQELFERAHLEPTTEQKYPFQLSGGMARRVLVSTAAMGNAAVVIADEPTPGMTSAMALEAMNTFRQMAYQNKAVLVITHDLGLASQTCDKVVVFYAGQTLEVANPSDFKNKGQALRHPYSKALWNALPQNGFNPVAGTQPSVDARSASCVYADRCVLCTPACCEASGIPLSTLRDGKVRCLNAS